MALFFNQGQNPISNFLGDGQDQGPYNNSSNLMTLGLGLLSGKTPQEQAGNAAAGFANNRQMGRMNNQTVKFLQTANPELAQAVQAGALSPADAYKLHFAAQAKNRSFQTLPDGTYGFADESTGTFNPLGKAAKPLGAGGGEYGLNPVYGTDPTTGKTGIGQVGKDGSWHLVDTGGFQPVGNTSNMNLGTTFQTRDKAGNVLSSTPIDNAGAASDTKFGTEQGGVRATYNSMASKMPGLESVVTKLDDLSGKATYTTGGQLLDSGMKQVGMAPRDAAIARTEYIATVNNQVLPLLRDTFGAAFTEREGDSLRNTLGDPDKTPQEKQVVLKSFIEQKRRDVEALATQAGGSVQAPQGGLVAPAQARPNAGTTSSGIKFSVEP